MGSRSTTGCAAACLFREFQLSASFQGLVETVPGVNLEVLRMDKYVMDPEKDTLFRGEFEVVKELIGAFEDGPASKAECDKVIDKNGPPPKGTGIKQLRENIAESKLSYEIMDDAAQAFLKTKIMDNIQKYVYLICFTGYLREQSKLAKDAGAEEFKLTGGKSSVPTENFNGREIFLKTLWTTLLVWPTLTSTKTLARSSTTFTLQDTICSRTCHKVITKRERNTVSLPRL